MTTLANVKWYINGNEWGVYEPAPSLLTYEEIVAMANTEGYPWTNTIAELNNSPTQYYNMFSQGGHMDYIWYRWTSVNYPIIENVIPYGGAQQTYNIYYINDLFVCDYNTSGWD